MCEVVRRVCCEVGEEDGKMVPLAKMRFFVLELFVMFSYFTSTRYSNVVRTVRYPLCPHRSWSCLNQVAVSALNNDSVSESTAFFLRYGI